MSTRFSEPEAAEIDAARGNTDRSVWLREAALAYLGRAQEMILPGGAPPTMPPAGPPPRTSKAAAPSAASCPHRLNPGAWCKICGRTKT